MLNFVGLYFNMQLFIVFFPRSFLTAAPGGVRRGRKEPARYVQRASATMSASGGVSAPALGTAVAGSSRRELLKAVLAQRSTSGPNGVARHGPVQRGSGRAKQALSHVPKHEETFGSLCSSGPQGLPACSVLAARILGKCDLCAPRLG